MRKLKVVYLALGLISLGLFGCEKQEQTEVAPQKEVVTAKDKAILAVVDLLNQQTNKELIIGELMSNPRGQKLTTIVSNLEKASDNMQAMQTLQGYIAETDKVNKLSDETGCIEIPELWLYQPNVKSDEVLVTYVPDGNEKDWKYIKAYNLKKEVVYLDVNTKPNVQVVVLETNGSEALKVKIDYMNKALQKAGLQQQNSIKAKVNTKGEGLETSKLNKIRLTDDKEPWIKGAAEIYAITSGIRDVNGKKEAEISIIDMPYLDNDGTDYYPNQILLFWSDYSYQGANIQIYEQDSNYNYKELTTILINGVATIAGTISTQPWIAALGTVASAIAEALPDEWYTDNDDYVDSFYTIMKTTTYTNYSGAANNAKMTLAPFFVPAN